MINLRKFAVLIIFECLIWAVPTRADVVTDWNDIASQAALQLAVPPRPGPTAILDLAMVHVAIHDAIQAYDGRFESYAVSIPNATGSPVAAAASAAHAVLVTRFPAQAGNLNTLLNNYLSSRGLLGNPGVAVGQIAAAGIINLRMGDGSFPPSFPNFVGGTGPGEWRPTLPAFAPMASPWLGAVVPFTLRESSQLRPSPPPPRLTSGEYTQDYNEVKTLGRINSTVRTAEQTVLATFYSDNFLALWERTLRGISNANIDNIGDSARLFALANMASADAIIGAWDAKKYYNFWRPITAIQEGENDGNPRTAGEPSWLPFLATPPYPEYPSGANNLTGAMTRTLELLLGDRKTFTVFSTTGNTTKTYHRFSDMAQDVVDVRVYQGIHFRSADEVARRTGTRAADWAFSHFLRHPQ
jgi:hypothetical protein